MLRVARDLLLALLLGIIFGLAIAAIPEERTGPYPHGPSRDG